MTTYRSGNLLEVLDRVGPGQVAKFCIDNISIDEFNRLPLLHDRPTLSNPTVVYFPWRDGLTRKLWIGRGL